MNTLTAQPWFWPALGVIVGLPLALLLLNELHGVLARRGSSYTKPVALLRNWVLPACAVYLLIAQLEQADVDATWSKIAATAFGFLIMLLLLSGANAALFGTARAGSWRERLPGIFIDLGRLVLIILGIGLLLSWVWGANIGGLIAAVGVTSIVIGLAVQTAVGPVIAGLLLLFEQPFRIGDWLNTSAAKGRVVEVNWRAAHIDTGNGIQIVPNAMLATGSFTNLSRVQGAAYQAAAELAFGPDDPPGAVAEALMTVAAGLPTRLANSPAKVVALGEARYKVSVPIASPADEGRTKALLLHRAWYAAQRAGLHLDEANPDPDAAAAYVDAAVHRVAAALGLGSEAAAAMSTASRQLLYAEGEIIQQVNSVPDAVSFITAGSVEMIVYAEDGRELSLGHLGVGDYIGGTSLTRQRMITGVVALTDTTIVSVPRDAMNAVVQGNARLARQIGDVIEMRRKAATDALAEAAAGVR
ncbi:small-conductance mechanosensitive channel [Mycolicibacterium sp. BK556]|uniref:mechanosensitive ion channel family protein n=1 Tax=unclassified Mycolicibacterium TaxID=2636767 RepID=UPI001609A6A3|nr:MULTISPECIES: mechanosensitive ion channel family protein [unclassified Mycolicibacterium]MBB3604078.1 small-conductance mechanosensitive channel [Mycolicibacterium sp. BK556]MBB3634274.1 small-conductance mechanosensitive channel [Mycolicibacterium sp. BK607]